MNANESGKTFDTMNIASGDVCPPRQGAVMSHENFRLALSDADLRVELVTRVIDQILAADPVSMARAPAGWDPRSRNVLRCFRRRHRPLIHHCLAEVLEVSHGAGLALVESVLGSFMGHQRAERRADPWATGPARGRRPRTGSSAP